MTLYKDNCWARLESVINWSQMSTNRFALSIGLKRAETLYHIERGDHGISRKLAGMIVTRFPEISLSWLLTGSGDMLTIMDANEKISYYNLDCESSIHLIDEKNPNSKIILPECIDADFAMRYNSAAMSNTIPPSSIVMLKRIDPNQIIYGNEYLIISSNITSLRVVRSVEQSDNLRLVATNRERYDDIIITKSEIAQIYKVTAKLIIN